MSINYNCLRAQHPLLDVAQRFLKKLKKIGAHHFAECPFHDDNTPSLCLYTNRSLEEQKFYCFSCQKGGDSLDLLEYFTGEKVFPGTSSSVKEIAQKPKEVPVDRIPSPDEIPGSTEFDPMLITHMESELWASPEAQKALSYALSRFSPNTIKAFRLGFLSRKLKANFKLANFKFADDRLIFPFLSKDQRLVGLIGRDITDSHECKYIFSKGFQKRFFLYGENLFEKYQKVSYSTLFLVEGPTDVLACFEHGFSALATCGTAINFVLVKNWLKKLALMNSLKGLTFVLMEIFLEEWLLLNYRNI